MVSPIKIGAALAVLLFSCTQKRQVKPPLFQFEQTKDIPVKKFNILFFVSSDCPLCKSYMPVIHNIALKYKGNENWNVLLVVEDEEISGNKNNNDGFIQVNDGNHELAKRLGATVTPEVYVADENAKVFYHGAIDNYAYETGKHRVKADQFYLEAALNSVASNKMPAIRKTMPVGCYIE